MKRSACALIALAAAELLSPAPVAHAQDYYQRYYDAEPRQRSSRRFEDEDAYFQRRAQRYRRDASTRDAPRQQEQRRGGFTGFLERLFGGNSSERADDRGGAGAVEIRRPPRQARRKPPTPSTPAAATAAAPPGMPPLPGALQTPVVPTTPTTFVAVFGDTVADELADGLAEGFADAPELAVRKHVKPNSGLVRSDYFDFVPQVEKVLGSEQVTYAVIDLGVNDRQPFVDKQRTPPFSDEWRKRYADRVDAIMAPFKERKIPVYWVGLAASESRKATADHTTLNSIIKERVEAAGGTYVDVWDGFVDEDGEYMAEGPLLDGQTGRLRLDDGVHFSKDGARKLAHYAEREIRKVFTPKPPSTDAVIGAVPQAGDAHPPALIPVPPGAPPPPKPISSPVVVLTEPRKAGDGALAGAAPVPAREASPDAEKVLVNGESLAAAPGRMDDHRWDGAKGLLDLATPPGQKSAPSAQAAVPAQPPKP